ncbi:MAG: M24 family metallopeptidase [Candidatus Hydrogenedentota bacterium]
MDAQTLFRTRIALVQTFCERNGLDGLLLNRQDNFAMATGGRRNYVSTGSDMGANGLLVTRGGAVYFVGNNIEAPRLEAEELGTFGCLFVTFPWHAGSPAQAVAERFDGVIASDDGSVGPNVHAALAPLRSLLTPAECEKYRRLGQCAAEAMTATLDAVAPGMTEADIAARLVYEGRRRRCRVPVALVAADDRITQYRHPVPTEAPLLGNGLEERAVSRYVMVVGGFVREGLVASITRFKAVAPLPAELADAYARICAVEVRMQEATTPSATLGDVFEVCRRAYAEFGFNANEWQHHHQGGATGYAGRTAKGGPNVATPVIDTTWGRRASEILGAEAPLGAAFAWNPSAPGVKSEDTFLLLPDGAQEIVTATAALPPADLPADVGKAAGVRKSGIMGA